MAHSETPPTGGETTPCATPIADLRAYALRHYEEVSGAALSWLNVIPRAINAYYDAEEARAAEGVARALMAPDHKFPSHSPWLYCACGDRFPTEAILHQHLFAFRGEDGHTPAAAPSETPSGETCDCAANCTTPPLSHLPNCPAAEAEALRARVTADQVAALNRVCNHETRSGDVALCRALAARVAAPAGAPDAGLREAVDRVTARVGCGDNSCLFVKPRGMATNGGCRCERKPEVMFVLAALYRAALSSTERTEVGR